MARIVRLLCKKLFPWLLIVFICYVTIEKIVYRFHRQYWINLNCNRTTCTRILFVADPQLIGNRNEIIHFITPFSMYDSDVYLSNTFSHALEFTKPDLIIFLGDLFDEGSIATDNEFHSYVRRLFAIFQINETPSSIRHIWLPGDNDIGGEANDWITEEKIRRFNRAFAQPDTIQHNAVTFHKVNKLTSSIPQTGSREFYDTRNIVVGLCHHPLIFSPSVFTNKVLEELKPHVIFAAHEHKSMLLSTDAILRLDRHILPIGPDNTDIFTYNLGVSDMYEILVPTCSYRMGTDKIGYGFATIDHNKLQYTVLWCPSRFLQLWCYLIVLIVAVLIYLLCFCTHVRQKDKFWI